MKKIKAIVFRELKARIVKKSFLISTLLGPVVMAVMMIVPTYLSTSTSGEIKVALFNFPFEIRDIEQVKFDHFSDYNFTARDSLFGKYQLLVNYQKTAYRDAPIIEYYYNGEYPLLESYLSSTIYEKLNSTEKLMFRKLKFDNKQGMNSPRLLYSYGAPILIYFFIFMYGIQIMKGITEEKTNRIVEVLLCTVSPFQLMIGKIMGIFSVAMVQFLIWGVTVFVSYKGLYSYFQLDRFSSPFFHDAAVGVSDDLAESMHILVTALSPEVLLPLIVVFLIYFVGGYFLYGALFAIVGAASDPETDTQQFLFPITVPLMLSFVLLETIISNTGGHVATWMSIIPFTSPIIMPAIVGVALPSAIVLISSIIMLLVAFLTMTWIASRIYRVGILTSGQKVSYGLLFKWFLRDQ